MDHAPLTSSSLETILQQLCSGDGAAAERVFVEYEPYLRAVVRRMLPPRLRPKFDSADIVQSAWSDVLTGFREAGWRFADARQLRAFLVRITHNRFIDRYRQHDRAARREQPLDAADPGQLAMRQATPSADAVAEDLWQHLLSRCPPEQRIILQMRRQGVPIDEIAAHTGRHPGSIRRILRQLAVAATGELAGLSSTPAS
jgi:RNA polymerase sigma factor (sigma-70 family)